MATIRYSSRQKKWIVVWKSRGMTFRQECSSENEAKAFSDAQETISRKEREVLIRRRRKKDMTVKELFDRHFLLCSKSTLTIEQDRHHSKILVIFFGKKEISNITKKDIFDFCTEQKKLGLEQSTIHRRISLLRSVIRWGIKNELISDNPFHGITISKGKSRRNAPPTLPELNALIKCGSSHIKRDVLLGIYTGARIGPSELFSLTWDDVDLKHGIISMPNARKGGKQEKRDIPIRKDLLPLIEKWKREDTGTSNYVIHWGGKPLRKIAASWRTALQKAKIHRPLRPYDLRHAYATYSMRSGADIKTTAEIMGHENAKMILQVYEHVAWDQKIVAIETLPDFFGLNSNQHLETCSRLKSGKIRK